MFSLDPAWDSLFVEGADVDPYARHGVKNKDVVEGKDDRVVQVVSNVFLPGLKARVQCSLKEFTVPTHLHKPKQLQPVPLI
jgi:hypothetical protein